MLKTFPDTKAGVAEIASNIIPTTQNFRNILEGDLSGADRLERPWQIFQWNEKYLKADFDLITKGRKSAPLSDSNMLIAPENIFMEPGAVMEGCMVNASAGPVYIGKNALIMEGAMIRGPFAACENSVVKMGAKIYGATTLGPSCVGGGEIKNVVMFGFSNKAHDGYLGDSVIGQWCNMGAGTNCSNVKNTAGTVYVQTSLNLPAEPAGIKAGLLMGDYSRCAINTSFNTGTVVGVCCNIFGHEMPAKYVPHFTWGKEHYAFEKALKDINNWKAMKGRALTDEEITILKSINK